MQACKWQVKKLPEKFLAQKLRNIQTCHSGLAQNQYILQEKPVFYGENLYDYRRCKENPFALLKTICILPNFKE